jgi:hypothetical protein
MFAQADTVIVVIKSRMMRWAWHVTHMRRDKKYIQNFGLKT